MSTTTDPTGFNLGKLIEGIELETVTTAQCADARSALERQGLGDLSAMLGIDEEGMADGLARGIWTAVPA